MRNALAAVVEAEDAIERLSGLTTTLASSVERIALALRLLGPTFKVSAGFEHPHNPLPRHDASLVDAWRTALKALEEGPVETPLPEPA